MNASDDQNRQPLANVESANDRGVQPSADATQSLKGDTDRLLAEQGASGLPHVIGRYQVKRWLGRGSFGTVYEGWDESLQRSVAIKVLTTARVPHAQVQVRGWLHEARTLAVLDHPGIVPVYDLGQDSAGRPFIVSKLIAGGSLAFRLAQSSFSYHEAARLVAMVARALDYAHRHQVVHRDVKPANILLGDNGEPVLADFGLAIHESELGTGTRFVGTPAYMSPEQARREGHRVDGRTDIYSLGVVFYELLTRKRPFDADGIEDLLDCVRHVEVRPPRQIERGIPKELEWICLKALAKRANDRYSVAEDFADELCAWIASVSTPSGGTVVETETKSPAESTGVRDSQEISVIPHGLRPFNAADADFFLHLLPGPRDRHGLPESVRFWKTQIEKKDPGETFRVGAVIGPSGSGKSSLVRAGIAPHLDAKITVLLVEARPEGFEAALHKRLRQLLPNLEQTTSLTEALIQFRRSRVSANGQRLLLVIDQFEQWLSEHGQDDSDFILEALRQCDGMALQALLLVRDDFTLALADFMNRLEEPLLQNHNFATVDFFSPAHAKKVLAAFGRAYGTVEDEPTRDQQRFLDLAIDELATNGKVVPVQLALFADMVKERPWVPHLLRDFGGARGVGVAFLDDRLNGPNAHPEFRSHRVLVRRLLASLLPADGVEVRPPALARSELMTPLLPLASETTIERVVGLLDSELRLVTPSVSSESGSAHSDSSVQDPAIQLTHDYLVPSIRQWLDVEERGTRRGRAMIRLRELAQAWNAKPEPRRLPAWTEWFTIHARTKRRDWNAAQRRMMRSADLRVTISLLLLTVVGVSLWFARQHVARRWQADSLAEQIVNADVAEIERLVSRLEPNRSAIVERLQQYSADLERQSAEASALADPILMDRRRLNIALVLARTEAAQGDRLVDLLPGVNVDDLASVIRAWPPHNTDLREKLWSRLANAATTRPETLLPFGAILAHDAAGDSRWPRHLPSLVKQFATSRTVYIREWINHFQPLAKPLGPELVRQLRGTSTLSDVARSNLLEAIIAYCPGHPAVLASAVASVRAEEFDSLIAAIDTAEPNLRGELRQKFADVEQTLSRRPPEEQLTADVAALHDAAVEKGGFVDARGALTYGLSRPEFTDLAEQMTGAGYSPSSIRPSGNGPDLQIATVWRKTNLASRVEWDLTGDTASEKDKSAAADGLWMEDFAWYPHGESDSGERRLVCLWVTNSTEIPTKCYFDRPSQDHDDFDSEWRDEGFTLHRYAERMDSGGTRTDSAIWRKTSDQKAESSTMHRFRGYFGDHEPGMRQTDLRITDFAMPMPDRVNIYNHWQLNENEVDDLKNKEVDELAAQKYQKEIDINREGAARRLSAMGRLEEAKAILLELFPRWRGNSKFSENLAVLYARAGLAEEFQPPFAAYCTSKYAKPHTLRYLRLLATVLAADVEGVKAELSELETARTSSDADFEVYLRGLAFIASHPGLGEPSTEATQTLRGELREMLTGSPRDSSSELLQEIDFDAIRDDPEIAQILFEQGLSQIVTATYREDSTTETRYLLSLPTAEHAKAAAALRLDGYLPVTLDVHARSSDGKLYLSSVWERQITSIRDRIDAARSRAQLAMTLARLGEDDLYVEGISGKWGSDVQSHLISESTLVVPAVMLIEILRTAKNEDLQRGLILAAGGYNPRTIPVKDLGYLQSRIASWAESARNAGVRQAACWYLTKWGRPPLELTPVSTEPEVKSHKQHLNWFTNSLGQTMIVLQPPERFLAGSPYWDFDRKPTKDESQHWVRIGRTFAVSATETTIEQFTQFLNDNRVQSLDKKKAFTYPKHLTINTNSPQIGVSWLDAVRFCQWLSEKEGLPESDWCYPGVLDAEGKAIEVPKNFRDRRGYRLPTEGEWEFAARGGSLESRHCGYDPQLLHDYEWCKENSGGLAHPVATLRPNSFGLFDSLGNAFEWTDGLSQTIHLLRFTYIRTDDLSLPTIPPASALYGRGGRYTFSANSARSCERDLVRDYDYRSATSGFRVVRTIEAEKN